MVGTAGSDTKCKWLTDELGIDAAMNYKDYNGNMELFRKDLAAKFPNGIDVYFDNTGGFQTQAVWPLLSNKARVALCGQISQYNSAEMEKITSPFLEIILRNIRVEGFLISEFEHFDKFHFDMKDWIKRGKIKCEETYFSGFENMPIALNGLFSGKNIGKMIVRISDIDTRIVNVDNDDKTFPDFGRLMRRWKENTKDLYFKSDDNKIQSKL